jgi:DtxR family Mn-dependent transcriptional regulator
MTVSVDNFVKTIYKQSILSEADTRLSTVAGILNISNAAATDMARKLGARQLVNYTKYKPLTLADKGKEHALRVIRKHRLWETFLHKTLNLSLYQIHVEAEQLEHQTSDFLANAIEEYLGKPSIDPHGDPIPSISGRIKEDNSQILLADADPGHNYVITRLSGAGKEFFDFCNSNDMAIDSLIRVENQFQTPLMTEIKSNQKTIVLNSNFTKFIFVKKHQK